jgi:hypothetical protein
MAAQERRSLLAAGFHIKLMLPAYPASPDPGREWNGKFSVIHKESDADFLPAGTWPPAGEHYWYLFMADVPGTGIQSSFPQGGQSSIVYKKTPDYDSAGPDASDRHFTAHISIPKQLVEFFPLVSGCFQLHRDGRSYRR